MASTPVDIANLALVRTHVTDFLESLEDEGTASAVFGVVYANARDTLLARHEWGFAKKEAALAELADVERSEWGYCFGLPADCLQPRRIYAGQRQTTSPVPYEIQANDALDRRILCCDTEEPTLIYTARVTAVVMFDSAFVDALAWGIAKEFSLAIPGKSQMLGTMEQKYEMAIATAKALSGRQGQKDAAPDGASVAARS